MNYTRYLGLAALLSLPSFVTCKDEGSRPEVLPDDPGGIPLGGSGGQGGSDPLDASVDATPDAAPDAAPEDASTSEPLDAGSSGEITNCGQLTCRGAGRCSIVDEQPTCVCDEGYVLSESSECVVDENCIKLRLLEPRGCRQRIDREPAVGLFFSVETCAGTNVEPEILGPVSTAFKVLEDDNALGDESFATVIDRDVESLVAIALDMSTSVAQNAALVQELIGSLKSFVSSLRPAEGAPPVYVSLIVFGRSVDVAVPFEAGIDAVISKLDEIAADPESAVTEPDGTNLNGTINVGMDLLETAWTQRIDATSGAVVLTGTLVTITDGRDTGGVTLQAMKPQFNAISIGVSSDIDDAELTRVGPQGSFLVPLASDRQAAFEAVAQRVAEYPSRAHLLAYCSPAVAGTHEVVVTLANLTAQASAVCDFNAQAFGVGAGACNEAFLVNYCSAENHPCGGFLACGLCEPDAGTTDDRAEWQFTETL